MRPKLDHDIFSFLSHLSSGRKVVSKGAIQDQLLIKTVVTN